MVSRQLFASTLVLTAAMMAGCSLQRGAVTGPTAVCASVPGTTSFLGWTTFDVPPGAVRMTWQPVVGSVTSYVLELGTTRGSSNVTVVEVSGSATSHTFFRLAAGDYFARVRAKNDCGAGAPSNEAIPRVR